MKNKPVNKKNGLSKNQTIIQRLLTSYIRSADDFYQGRDEFVDDVNFILRSEFHDEDRIGGTQEISEKISEIVEILQLKL